MSKKLDNLNQFVPRPQTGPTKRHMIAVEPEAYDYITELAEELKTTRNRVVTALVEYYKSK